MKRKRVKKSDVVVVVVVVVVAKGKNTPIPLRAKLPSHLRSQSIFHFSQLTTHEYNHKHTPLPFILQSFIPAIVQLFLLDITIYLRPT